MSEPSATTPKLVRAGLGACAGALTVHMVSSLMCQCLNSAVLPRFAGSIDDLGSAFELSSMISMGLFGVLMLVVAAGAGLMATSTKESTGRVMAAATALTALTTIAISVYQRFFSPITTPIDGPDWGANLLAAVGFPTTLALLAWSAGLCSGRGHRPILVAFVWVPAFIANMVFPLMMATVSSPESIHYMAANAVYMLMTLFATALCLLAGLLPPLTQDT